jgi:hypothetical protein
MKDEKKAMAAMFFHPSSFILHPLPSGLTDF